MNAISWLRKRLLPHGEDVLLYAAFAIILTALISFVLSNRYLPPLRYYGTLLALSAMLVLHIVEPDLTARWGKPLASWFHILANGALFLLANALGLADGPTFRPFLLFMLVSEGVVNFGLGRGLAYGLGLSGSWFLLIWLRGSSLDDLLANLVNIGLGLIFTVTFSIVLVRYAEQTARAEALAAHLQAANAELEAARRRERELAAAEERLRLARDIHDGLGHHLTALNVQLQAASRLFERDPARAALALATSRQVAQAALDEVRQSVATMRRSPLDGRSLPEAIEALVAEFGERAGLKIRFDLRGSLGDLAPAAAMTLYRAAQEGLTNAQKHAAAKLVIVTLAAESATVRLSVADDGRTAASPNGHGFGLAGLRERAEQLGGSMYAGPSAHEGFELIVELPLSKD